MVHKSKKVPLDPKVYENLLRKIPDIDARVLAADTAYAQTSELKKKNKDYVMVRYPTFLTPQCPQELKPRMRLWIGLVSWYKNIKEKAKQEHMSIKEYLLKQKQLKISF